MVSQGTLGHMITLCMCGGKSRVRLDDPLQLRAVDLQCASYSNTSTRGNGLRRLCHSRVLKGDADARLMDAIVLIVNWVTYSDRTEAVNFSDIASASGHRYSRYRCGLLHLWNPTPTSMAAVTRCWSSSGSEGHCHHRGTWPNSWSGGGSSLF